METSTPNPPNFETMNIIDELLKKLNLINDNNSIAEEPLSKEFIDDILEYTTKLLTRSSI
jgi:hypothetical protein